MPRSATIVLDSSLAITAASPAAAALLGVAAPVLIGRPCRAVLACQGCEGNCPARRLLAGGVGLAEPVSARARESNRPVLISPELLTAPGLGGCRVALHLREPAAPSEVSALFSRRLLPLASVEGGLQSVLDELRLFCGADLAAIASYAQEEREVRWQMAAGQISGRVTEIRLRPGQGFAGRIVVSRRPLQTCSFPADLTRDPASYPIFLHEELRSGLGVPLEAGGRPVGVLMIGNRQSRRFGEDDRLVLGSVAEVIALAAENLRLFQAASRRAASSERRRLAEEVHDGLSQHLFGLRLLLSDVQESLAQGDPAEVQAGLRQVSRTLDKSLGEVRRLIQTLRGEEVAQPGLVDSLCDYLEYFCRMSGLEVELSLKLPAGREIHTPHGHEILRIAQEALANVHRHARASHVHVELAAEGAGYRLQVRDDGQGFDPAASQPPGHFGLKIMRERAGRTGSGLEIRSAPGEGTVVTVRFPGAP